MVALSYQFMLCSWQRAVIVLERTWVCHTSEAGCGHGGGNSQGCSGAAQSLINGE